MDISGDYLFDAPQNLVWEALLDPNVLGSIMPGGQGIETVGENTYKGMLQIKIGPVQGTFQGDIQLTDIKAPEGYHMNVDGKGAPGFVKATGQIQLETRGSQTHLAYSGQAQIGGRIASVGQRLIESSARSIIRQSLEALNEYLKVKVAEQSASLMPELVSTSASNVPADVKEIEAAAKPGVSPQPTPIVSPYKPPSQMSLMLNVARDVLNDFIPMRYQPLVAGGIIVLIVLLIWFFASR